VSELKTIFNRQRLLQLACGPLSLKKSFWKLLQQPILDQRQLDVCVQAVDCIEVPNDPGPCCFLFEAGYPEQLLHLTDPPPVLFLRGNAELLKLSLKQQVAIVGSRHASHDALALTERFSAAVVEAGIVVVSGLAYGVDAAAHRGALRGLHCASTIAVLASGVAKCSPLAHRTLYEEILQKGGLIVSEHPLFHEPHKLDFLARNRIIAALASMTLVVQAQRRSGALVTARLASELGRDVAAVPWSLNVHAGVGSNHLIQGGAYCILSYEDILDHLGITRAGQSDQTGLAERTLSQLSLRQRQAIELLMQKGQLHSEQLRSITGLDPIELCDLELKELIRTDHFGFVSVSC
jgi:DNA protecting protein DprA